MLSLPFKLEMPTCLRVNCIRWSYVCFHNAQHLLIVVASLFRCAAHCFTERACLPIASTTRAGCCNNPPDRTLTVMVGVHQAVVAGTCSSRCCGCCASYWCTATSIGIKEIKSCPSRGMTFCTWPDSLQLKVAAIVCQSEYDVQSVRNTTCTSWEDGATCAATAEMASSSCSSRSPATLLCPWRMARTRSC